MMHTHHRGSTQKKPGEIKAFILFTTAKLAGKTTILP